MYNWARHCQSVATEVEASSPSDRAKTVAEHVTKSWRTVARYLAVLELPEVVHPLLYDGPEGSEEDWNALQNHNDRVKEYGPLPWAVAEPLGRAYRKGTIGSTRAIGLAAKAVIYDREIAEDLITRGIEHPNEPLSAVEQFARQYSDGSPDLWVPRVTVSMSDQEKQAIMRHCGETHQPMSALVEELLGEFANALVTSDEASQTQREVAVMQLLDDNVQAVENDQSESEEADSNVRQPEKQSSPDWIDAADHER